MKAIRSKVLASTAILLALLGSVALAADSCPNRKSGTRVLGGTDAAKGEWRFQAYITGGKGVCGGTLIAPTYILTAAHCVTSGNTASPLPAAHFAVRLDSIEAHKEGEFHAAGASTGVRRVIVHPHYDPATAQNDIALLELVKPSSVPPVRLESVGGNLSSGGAADGKVLGWGRVDNNDWRTPPSILKEAPVRVIPAASCTVPATFAQFGAIDSRRVCAHGDRGEDTCAGDSGGPLLARNASGEYVQIGVTSFGSDVCVKTEAPGVYTRVAAFADFLKAQVGLAATSGPLTAAAATLPEARSAARSVAASSAMGVPASAGRTSVPSISIFVSGMPETPVSVIPGAVEANSAEAADYAWDVQLGTVRKRSLQNYVADGVTDVTKLSGVLTKWGVLPTLEALQSRAPLNFAIVSRTPHAVFRDQEDVTPTVQPVADGTLKYLTIFDLTSDGTIDYLFPLAQDGGENGGSWDPKGGMRLNETKISCPFGADHVVAIATAESPTTLRRRLRTLSELNYPAAYAAVEAVEAELKGKRYSLGIANFYTAP